ncbi:NUDIX hydrolase [Candidatus Microgenomates bacterium]|nr:NUDIX hydrolase [Candidatus Microgenomates bacterium]
MKRVVVGIINRKSASGEDAYLLVSSKKSLGKYTGFYYPPGGHLESGEDPQSALVREIREELSPSARPIRQIASTPGDVPGQITYWWECQVSDGQIALEEALNEAAYFTQTQMKNLPLWPATRQFFDQYIFKVGDR